MPKQIYSVADVSRKMGVTPQYVRKLIRSKELAATDVGKQWVVSERALEAYFKKNNIVEAPKDHRREEGQLPDITALSFFSGAMGLDIGMRNAGIPALLACEVDKYCRMTIHENAPDMALIGDVGRYTADEILAYAGIPANRGVDVIFGGPPCQAFSTAGARRAFDDERGNVFLKYLDIIGEIKPRYVVIENVRGLLSAAYPYGDVEKPFKGGALLIILDKLRSFGYTVSFNLYNAANYGAPQIRERVVLLGKLHGEKVPYLQPTHSDEAAFGLKPWRVLRDAFSSLPASVEHHSTSFPEKRLKYYRMLGEGQYWKDLPAEVQKEAMGNAYLLGGGKTGFYRRVSYSRPSPTLVTNPTMPATDLCHPTSDRPLSVEEYKAIQEFPNDWRIFGPILEQYKQIGNAVPIKLGEAIGRAILDDMQGIVHEPVEGFRYSRYRWTEEVSWEKTTRELYERLRAEQTVGQAASAF